MDWKPARQLAVFAAFFAGVSGLRAGGTPTFTWTGASENSSFNNSGNWQGGSAPTGSGTENVVFGDTLYQSIYIDSDLALQDITFDTTNTYYFFFGDYDAVPTLTLNGGISAPNASSFAGATFNSTINLALPSGSHDIDIASPYPQFSIDGVISGPGSLIKDGPGTLSLGNANNTFSGGVVINDGMVGVSGTASLGTGPVSILGAAYPSTGLYNNANNDLTIGNNLTLGDYATFQSYYGNLTLTGSIAPAVDVATVNVLGFGGNVLFLTGNISGAAEYVFGGDSRIVLSGTNSYDGGTGVSGGALVFGTASSIPTTGSIGVSVGAYAGVADPAGLTAFLGHLDHTSIYGALGLDSYSGGPTNTFNHDVDLSAFTNPNLYFGTISSAILQGDFTPPAGATAYNFGGSGGLVLQNPDPLADIDGTHPRSLHAATYGNTDSPFFLVLQGAAINNYTGGTYADGGGIIFDASGAIPASGGLNYTQPDFQPGSTYSIVPPGSYLGITEMAGVNGTTISPADFVALVAAGSHQSTSIIGFDSHDYISNILSPGSVPSPSIFTVTNLDLSAITGSIYVGTATSAIIDGTFTTTDGGTDNYFFAGYGGNADLEVTSLLTGALSATIGLPNVSRSDGFGVVRLTNADNDYSGGTTLWSGELFLAASTTGSPGSVTAGPIGTGPLYVNPYSGSAMLSFGASSGMFANDVVLQNYNTLNVSANNPDGLTLAGTISGEGNLSINSSDPITLSHANTYYGGTTIDGSSVTASANAAFGNSLVDLEDGAHLTFTSSAPHLYGLQDNYQSSSDATNTITLAAGSTLTIDAPNFFTSSSDISTPSLDFSGNIGEAGPSASLVKTGTSTEYLYGNNTYTGGTTINGGVIVAGNGTALGTGTVTINSGANGGLGLSYVTLPNTIVFGANGGGLGGSGTFNAPIAIGTNSYLKPGDHSAGDLAFAGGLTLAGGGTYQIVLQDAHGARGSGYSSLDVTNALAFTATSGSPFDFTLVSLDLAGNKDALANFNPADPYSWTIAQTTAGFTDGENLILNLPAGAYMIDSSNFTDFNSLNGGTFALEISGNSLLLDFNPASVPEPSTWALLLSGLGVIGLLARRRRA